MKKLFLILTLSLMSLFAFSQSQRYYDLKNLYRSYGYSIGNEQVASCVQGGSAYTIMAFTPSSEYVVVAMSDDSDVTDVDIYLYYADGTLFMKDTDSSHIAILAFRASSYANTKIVIKNYRSLTPTYASTLRYFIAYK